MPAHDPISAHESTWPSGLVIAAIVAFAVLVGAFTTHLARYGGWIVDDAGISMAYAANLVHGHGLAAAPGAARVEGYSNPLWVVVLAIATKLGLVDGGSLLGGADYAVVLKALAVALHGVVLGALGIAIHRVVTVASRGVPNLPVTLACWIGAGLLLAANPSYVIWMGSGLENPLLAAEVSIIAALVVWAVPTPTRGTMCAIGAIAGLAALTRPDGAAYLIALPVVAVAAAGLSWSQRWSKLWPGLVAFAIVFGPYVVFRRLYFEAWVPNTAVAKGQGMPSPRAVGALADIFRAYGWGLVVITVAGTVLAVVQMFRARNEDGIRVVGAGVALIAIGAGVYVVLIEDWMGEYRFLTAMWPLVSAATALSVAQIVAVVPKASWVRTGVVVVLVGAVVGSVWRWPARADEFRTRPTLALCEVATQYGVPFVTFARQLGRAPSETSLLLADIGGVLLATDLKVVDLGGLADRRIARFLRASDADGLASYILDDVKPVFIQIHEPFDRYSGLRGNPALAQGYAAISGDQNWVRRDVLAKSSDPDAALARMRVTAITSLPNPRNTCAAVLFGHADG